jgi:hypothetical protein
LIIVEMQPILFRHSRDRKFPCRERLACETSACGDCQGGSTVRHLLQLLLRAFPALIIAGSAVAADYSETFEETRPVQDMFEGQLLIGEVGGWKGEIKKGTYFLIDRNTPGAIKPIVLPQPVESGTIAVSVFGQFQGEKAGAGLVYGYEPDRGYYAFVVTPNKGYALYRAGPDEIQALSKGTNDAIQVASVNHLSAEVDGTQAILFVNGKRVFAHAVAGGAPLAGQVGIVAIDLGAYSFDDFSLSYGTK